MVGVNVGDGTGVGVAVVVAVGKGVGVFGIISRVAARHARVANSRNVNQRYLNRVLPADIMHEFSTGWGRDNLAFCIQEFW